MRVGGFKRASFCSIARCLFMEKCVTVDEQACKRDEGGSHNLDKMEAVARHHNGARGVGYGGGRGEGGRENAVGRRKKAGHKEKGSIPQQKHVEECETAGGALGDEEDQERGERRGAEQTAARRLGGEARRSHTFLGNQRDRTDGAAKRQSCQKQNTKDAKADGWSTDDEIGGGESPKRWGKSDHAGKADWWSSDRRSNWRSHARSSWEVSNSCNVVVEQSARQKQHRLELAGKSVGEARVGIRGTCRECQRKSWAKLVKSSHRTRSAP